MTRPPKALIAFARTLSDWGLPTFVEKPSQIGTKIWWWSLTVGPLWHKTRILRYSPVHRRIEFLWFDLPTGRGIVSALREALRTDRYGQHLLTLKALADLQPDFRR